MNIAAALLLLAAALAHLAPEHAAAHWGGTPSAWEYVGYALESAALWLFVLAVALALRGIMAAEYCAAMVAVSLYGAAESLQRVAGRLCFPMDRPPPKVHGRSLLDIALNFDVSAWSLVAIGAVSVYVWGANARR